MNWKITIIFRDGYEETYEVYDILVRGYVLELQSTPYFSKNSKVKGIPLDLIKEYTSEYIGKQYHD